MDINGLKEKFLKKAVDVADLTKEMAKKAGEKTKTLAQITKLTAEIAGEKDTIKKNYTALGKLCYERFKDLADDDFMQLITEIKTAEENIAEKQAQIDELKADGADDDIEVEFFEEAEAEAAEIVEEKAEEAEKTVEEAAETVEEAVETAEE